MNIRQLNEELETYFVDEKSERYFGDMDMKQYDPNLNDIDTVLYLYEHQLDWTLGTLDNFFNEILPLMGYTKTSKENEYFAFTNGKYNIKRYGIKQPGGYGVDVKTIDDNYLFGIRGTMPHPDVKFGPPGDFKFEDLKDFIQKIQELD